MPTNWANRPHIVLIGTAGIGIIDIGEPLDGGRHLGQPLKLLPAQAVSDRRLNGGLATRRHQRPAAALLVLVRPLIHARPPTFPL